MPDNPIITLTTDFGEEDYFVAAMKGVIASINPEARIIDLSHWIKRQDIFDGAFFIGQSYRYFPAGTIHCVVVDPGVGTSRRPLVVSADNHCFVAPDNGVLSLIYDQAETVEVVHAMAAHYFRSEISQTFHGRDIFAPLAAWLSRGTVMAQLGDSITDFVRFKSPQPRSVAPNRILGAVTRVDHFGNCITNITPQALPGFFSPSRPEFKFRVGTAWIQRICNSYAEADGESPFVILGSSDHFEISVNRGSAAASLKVARGAEVEVAW